MLNMKVKDYIITSDENSVTVYQYVRNELGEIAMRKNIKGGMTESTRVVGYYPTLEVALKGIQKHYINSGETDIQTIEDYRKALSDITESFKKEIKL